MLADRAVDRDILLGDLAGPGEGGIGARGRAAAPHSARRISSSAQRRLTAVGRVAASIARGAHRAPRRTGRRASPAPRHRPRPRRSAARRAPASCGSRAPRRRASPARRSTKLVRQPRLVDDLDRAPSALEPDRAHRPAADALIAPRRPCPSTRPATASSRASSAGSRALGRGDQRVVERAAAALRARAGMAGEQRHRRSGSAPSPSRALASSTPTIASTVTCVVVGMPAIVIGDHRHRRVADLGLAGELGLGHVGHADHVATPGRGRAGFRRGSRIAAPP